MHESLKGITDPILANLLAAQATVNAEAQDVHERQKAASDEIARYLAVCAAPPGQTADAWGDWPADAGHVDLVRPSKLARREGCSITTITRRCDRERVGKKYGRHWRVSLWRNEAWKKSQSK